MARRYKGFIRVDSDSGGKGSSKAAQARRAFLNKRGAPEEFMKVARYSQEPIVLEFGMLATLGAIALLDRMRQAGAEVWWFDGNRDEAFQAWKNENRKSGRVFDTGDAKWGQVVRYIDDNRDAIDAFFGSKHRPYHRRWTCARASARDVRGNVQGLRDDLSQRENSAI